MMRFRSARWLPALVGSLLGAACGDDDGGGGTAVTADEIRTFYGLWPGTCLVYDFDGGRATAVVDLREPLANEFPDRDAVVWELSSVGNVFLPHRRFLEARGDGTITLLRDDSRPDGTIVQRIYAGEGGVEPSFGRFRRAGEDLTFAGSTFVTSDARPAEARVGGALVEDPPVEVHRWEVVLEEDAVGSEPPLDSTTRLNYTIERENVPATSVWNFVPEVGFVRIQDFDFDDGGTGEVFLLRSSQVCGPGYGCPGNRPSECAPIPG